MPISGRDPDDPQPKASSVPNTEAIDAGMRHRVFARPRVWVMTVPSLRLKRRTQRLYPCASSTRTASPAVNSEKLKILQLHWPQCRTRRSPCIDRHGTSQFRAM